MQTQSDYRLLPIFLQSKLAILNPRNRDQKSFGHAIALFITHLIGERNHLNKLLKHDSLSMD